MVGCAGRIGFAMMAAAAVAVAASGMAAGDAFAEQEVALAMRYNANYPGESDSPYLRSPSYPDAFTPDGKTCGVVIGGRGGPPLLDIADPANTDGLRRPGPGNFESSTQFATAITPYIGNDGNRYFAMARSAADVIRTSRIHNNGRLDSLTRLRGAGKMGVPVDLHVHTVRAGTCLLCCQVADGSGTPATPQIRTINVVAVQPQYLEPDPEPQQESKQEPPQEGPEQEPESSLPAIVRQYDADGGVMEQGEWPVAMAGYTADPPNLTAPQIPQMAAHRGQATPGACTP